MTKRCFRLPQDGGTKGGDFSKVWRGRWRRRLTAWRVKAAGKQAKRVNRAANLFSGCLLRWAKVWAVRLGAGGMAAQRQRLPARVRRDARRDRAKDWAEAA